MHLVIGVGTQSVSGKLIELALLGNGHERHTFEVNPIDEELSFEEKSFRDIQLRSFDYARKMRRLYSEAICIGVTSGVAKFQGATTRGFVRYDILSCLDVKSQDAMVCFLNENNCHWQLREKIISYGPSEESIARTCLLVKKVLQYSVHSNS